MSRWVLDELFEATVRVCFGRDDSTGFFKVFFLSLTIIRVPLSESSALRHRRCPWLLWESSAVLAVGETCSRMTPGRLQVVAGLPTVLHGVACH